VGTVAASLGSLQGRHYTSVSLQVVLLSSCRLDFDGCNITNSAWNSNNNTIVNPAFDKVCMAWLGSSQGSQLAAARASALSYLPAPGWLQERLYGQLLHCQRAVMLLALIGYGQLLPCSSDRLLLAAQHTAHIIIIIIIIISSSSRSGQIADRMPAAAAC
jgi:hypothetical protein